MTKWEELIDRLARIETKLDVIPDHNTRITEAQNTATEAKELAITSILKLKVWITIGIISFFILCFSVGTPVLLKYWLIDKSYSQESSLTKNIKMVK